jgi:hypothetical protein
MKKILYAAMGCSMLILAACNGGTKTNETDGTDSSAAMTDTSSSAGAMTQSAPMMKTIQLTSDQEVPSNTSGAKGTAEVTYNKDTKTLSYTVNYSGLTGKATMAHIHGTAAKGVNAGVKVDLTPKLQKETSGNFSDSVKIDNNGISEDSLMQGLYYFNIHTPKNPGGEIRGQIEF